MSKYFMRFSYIGTRYRGLQVNCNNLDVRDVDTVQGALQSALLTLQPRPDNIPKLHLSSRTDKGVHALCNTGHFYIENGVDYSSDENIGLLNKYFGNCSHDIRILSIDRVTDDFHARHAVKSREYLYRIQIPKDIRNHQKPICDLDRTYCCPRIAEVDLNKMRRGLELFKDTFDYRSFSGRDKSDRKLIYVRKLDSIKIVPGQALMPIDPLTKLYDYWDIKISARSFLYNQVRRIVTTLVSLGLGAITERDIEIMKKVPSHTNFPVHMNLVPPHGLYLVSVNYDQEELKNFIIN